MRHEHLIVTVESGTKERIDADLDAGESLEAWVADAVELKLAETEREDETDEKLDARHDRIDADEDGTDDEATDDYDEGFEYVDDCAI
ncbi:hypothetical protein [Halorussus salinisoli]|uniref:hypothetical protein n=1 Tax=Halorussus salinisoli TaxID=2558242 RepID=UPI0010C1BCF7|nr:hypothetical protein [Halorussus salinisoli]